MGRLFGEPQRITTQATAGKLAVLYDGGCEMCRTVAAGILRYDNTESLELLDANDPAARGHFSELRLDDLKGSAGVLRLKEELLRRVNVAAAPYKVRDVLLKEMIVQ